MMSKCNNKNTNHPNDSAARFLNHSGSIESLGDSATEPQSQSPEQPIPDNKQISKQKPFNTNQNKNNSTSSHSSSTLGKASSWIPCRSNEVLIFCS